MADPAQMRLQIYPRRKAGQKKRDSSTGTAVVVTLDVLQGFADIPLVHAAKKLGISKTALKSACRTLGLERWPFRRPADALSIEEPEPKGVLTLKKRKSAERVRRGTGRGRSWSAAVGKRQKVARQNPATEDKEGESETPRLGEDEEEREGSGDEEEGSVDEAGEQDGESVNDFNEDDSKDAVFDHRDDIDKIDRRSEDWESDTEEGDGIASSHGVPGSSDKTSSDEAAERSSCDEGCAEDAAQEEELNDLSWMSHGDAGLESFGQSSILDEAPLLPLVINGPPPVATESARDGPAQCLPCPKPTPQRQHQQTLESDASGFGDEYHLHMSGDYFPPVSSYTPAARHVHDYHYTINKFPRGQHARHHAMAANHPMLHGFSYPNDHQHLSHYSSWLPAHSSHASIGLGSLAACGSTADRYAQASMHRQRVIREMALDSAQAQCASWTYGGSHQPRDLNASLLGGARVHAAGPGGLGSAMCSARHLAAHGGVSRDLNQHLARSSASGNA